jgi:4-hydroxybenzoate polyprenyltransferase
MRWLVFIPLLENTGFQSQIPEFIFFLLVLSTVLIAAAGYVINDYFDRKADLINRPGKVILGRILKRRAGMFWHVVLNIIGVGIGVYVSYKLGLLRFSIIFVFISGLLWFYSTTYKRQVLLGNLVVGFMVAMVPLLLLLFELPLIFSKYRFFIVSDSVGVQQLVFWISGYSMFAFLLTLQREIVKDLEDFEGDFAFGRQTIPIAWGSIIAKRITMGLTLGTVVLISIINIRYLNDYITLGYTFFVLVLPLLILLYKLYKADSKDDYHTCSTLIKIIMLGGIVYSVVAYLFVF